MTQDWTPEEELALEAIAKTDQWEPDRLERAVRNKIMDLHCSFKKAVMLVLAEAERPPDVDPKEELKKKIEAERQKQKEIYMGRILCG